MSKCVTIPAQAAEIAFCLPGRLCINTSRQRERATIEGNTAEQGNLCDQIEVDKYLSSKTAARKRGWGSVVPRAADPDMRL